MDVIVLGVYNSGDKEKLEQVVATNNSLELVWNFDRYNIEASEGIQVLLDVYRLFQVGILVEKQRDSTFSSYPLISEVTDTFFGKSITPKLFQFLEDLEKSCIPKMIIAFADEWDKNTTVKIEKCTFKELRKRLNSVYVWCDVYVNLSNNTRTRDDYHPLILDVG